VRRFCLCRNVVRITLFALTFDVEPSASLVGCVGLYGADLQHEVRSNNMLSAFVSSCTHSPASFCSLLCSIDADHWITLVAFANNKNTNTMPRTIPKGLPTSPIIPGHFAEGVNEDDDDFATAAAAATANDNPDGLTLNNADSRALLQYVRSLQEGQTHQTQLIMKLNKTVLTTRSMINELIVTQNELKEEVERLKASSLCDGCKLKAETAPPLPLPTVAGQTPDEEINAIIEARRRKGTWPVKLSTVNCFSVSYAFDLL
jgi:hypothetical protein